LNLPLPEQFDFEYQLDHIGIAVESLNDGFKFYEALGFKGLAIEEVPSEKVRVGFIPLQNSANLELLEATSEESPIYKFVQKRGPGIHHICLRVKDIDLILNRLKSKGVRLLNEVPKQGAHNCRIAFIHPASTGGVLIELSEKSGGINE
jgi:methylmalonyl-CoA/ethylmalonyl-CoA epimerase